MARRPLTERLEAWSGYTGSPLGNEAKAEIERLRAALRRIVESKNNKNWRKPELVQEAEAALRAHEQSPPAAGGNNG